MFDVAHEPCPCGLLARSDQPTRAETDIRLQSALGGGHGVPVCNTTIDDGPKWHQVPTVCALNRTAEYSMFIIGCEVEDTHRVTHRYNAEHR